MASVVAAVAIIVAVPIILTEQSLASRASIGAQACVIVPPLQTKSSERLTQPLNPKVSRASSFGSLALRLATCGSVGIRLQSL